MFVAIFRNNMNVRFSIHTNAAVIAVVSLIVGCFSSYYELSQLFLNTVIRPNRLDYGIAIGHLLFFTVLSGLLIYINTRRIRSAENIRHFLRSLLVVAIFSFIAWWIVNPFIQESNKRHADIYEEYFSKQERSVWENWESEKRSHYFHDSGADWIERSVFLFLGIYVISRIYNMAQKEKEMKMSYEQLKNESLQSQINALNNQINPHFFFNALNALHGLIVEGEQQKSLEYLASLSNVFRYILQSGKKELVGLSEEFTFLNMFRFMLAVKYGEKLRFDIRLDGQQESYRLPVLSLLPILENVTKHNEVSSRHPLVIEIFMDGDWLVIRNAKRSKLDSIDSDGIGLENLSNRFKLLTGHEIRIADTTESFSVLLPLINLYSEKHESNHY